MLLKCAFVIFLSVYFAPSYSTIVNIPNPQTKNQKSADLAEVQLQDVEAYRKENKLNENDGPVLRRRIAPTDVILSINNSSSTDNGTQAIKIATEGSGVTKLITSKDNLNNNTSNNAGGTVVVVEHPHAVINATKIETNSTKLPTINSTTVETKPKEANVTVKSTPAPRVVQNSTIAIPITKPTIAPATNTSTTTKATTTTTTTTTMTTTTTTTSTTTTPKPRKPTVTYSIEDMPEIANVVPEPSKNSKILSDSKPTSTKLSVDEPEQPIAQPSQEFDSGLYRNHRDYIIPFVSIIFAVPILMGMVIVAYRRFRDFWSTRHYRRMDFLVDGMYND